MCAGGRVGGWVAGCGSYTGVPRKMMDSHSGMYLICPFSLRQRLPSPQLSIALALLPSKKKRQLKAKNKHLERCFRLDFSSG